MIKVNLLKPEQKDPGKVIDSGSDFMEVKEEKINIPAAVIVAVLTIGIIGFLYITQTNTLEAKKKLYTEKQAEKKKLDAQLKDIKKLKKLKKELQERIKTIKMLKKQQKQPVYMLLEISKAIPERVWINKITIKGAKISFSGTALSQNLIATFTKNIESSVFFRNLNWGGFTKKNQKGVDLFIFRFSVDFVLSSIKEGV